VTTKYSKIGFNLNHLISCLHSVVSCFQVFFWLLLCDRALGRALEQSPTNQTTQNDTYQEDNDIFDLKSKEIKDPTTNSSDESWRTSVEMGKDGVIQTEPNAASSNDIVLMAALKGNSYYPQDVMYQGNGYGRDKLNEEAQLNDEEEKLIEEEKIIENEKVILEDEKALLEDEKMHYEHNSMSDLGMHHMNSMYRPHHHEHVSPYDGSSDLSYYNHRSYESPYHHSYGHSDMYQMNPYAGQANCMHYQPYHQRHHHYMYDNYNHCKNNGHYY
jgi:hypothetical protein